MADELNDSIENADRAQQKFDKLRESVKKAIEEQQTYAETQREIFENLGTSEQRSLLHHERMLKSSKSRVKLLEEQNKKATTLLEKEKTAAGLHDENVDSLKRQIELRLEMGHSVDDLTAKLEAAKKEQKEFAEQVEKSKKQADDLLGAFSNLAKGNLTAGLTGIGKAIAGPEIQKGLGSVREGIRGLITNIGGGGSAGMGATAMLGGLTASLVAVGIAAAAWQQIFKLAIEVGDAQSAFMKATGSSREFASSLNEITEDVRKFGASSGEAGESFQALFTGVSDFTMMSAGAREEITKNAVALSKLGVSNEDFARGSQIAIKAMSQTGTQAAATQREIAALGMDIGVAPSKMASDFASAGPQLAKFGSDGVQTFKDLAVAAKVTGIEVDRLMSITGQFDTFEGAATAAGKLNAALGGNFVNAMELVTATDPVERFNMIRDSILDAGLSFDEMSYYQRKFFAESAGLEGEAELAALMSGNMDSLAGGIGKTSDQYADMAEKAAKAQSFQEKLNTLFMALIPVVEPVVEMLTSLSDWMMENIDSVVTGMKVALVAVTGLAAGIAALSLAFLVGTLPITGTMVAIGLVTAAFASLASLIFIESFASNFVDGVIKLGKGVGSIGDAAGITSGEIKSLTGDMDDLGKSMFTGNENILVGTKMTGEGLAGVGTAGQVAADASGNLITANRETMREVTRETNNNYGSGGGKAEVEIKLASGVSDFLDAKIKKGIGNAALAAVMGG
jgi:hypothetical protein